MNNKFFLALLALALNATALSEQVFAASERGDSFDRKELSSSMRLGVVDFKKCIEESKLGKQEAATFEGLKKKMEGLLEQKEKQLEEVAAKFNDPDYLDSLSTEAENELKHKFRTLNQEVAQDQNFYMQTLNQTNVRVMQKLTEVVESAAAQVGKDTNYDIIFNKEMCFYSLENYDVTKAIIKAMDEAYEKESKK